MSDGIAAQLSSRPLDGRVRRAHGTLRAHARRASIAELKLRMDRLSCSANSSASSAPLALRAQAAASLNSLYARSHLQSIEAKAASSSADFARRAWSFALSNSVSRAARRSFILASSTEYSSMLHVFASVELGDSTAPKMLSKRINVERLVIGMRLTPALTGRCEQRERRSGAARCSAVHSWTITRRNG